MSRWQQQSIKLSMGIFQVWALHNCTACNISHIIRHLNTSEKTKPGYENSFQRKSNKAFHIYLLGPTVLSRRSRQFLSLLRFPEFKYLYNFQAHLLHIFFPQQLPLALHINQMIYGPSAVKLPLFLEYIL